jgi:hypothetical protein
MEEIQVAIRVQLRRDVESDWIRDNPTLLPGEIAISLDLNKFKIGNGSTWSSTSYYSSLPDLENTLSSYVEVGDVGNAGGPAKLDADGNLLIPKDKIIIEGATANDHELTLQSPDISSDITVTLPNSSGTIALASQIVTSYNGLTDKPSLFSGSYQDLTNKPSIPSLNGYATENYVDGLAVNYDSVGSASAAQTAAATDATTKANAAKSEAISAAATDATTKANAAQAAAEGFATQSISNLIDSAPETLNTLSELAAAINDDKSYAATITTALGQKEPLLPEQSGNSGKFLTTDGTSKSWSTVAQYTLPTQNNNSGKFLTTDGTAESWASIEPSAATPTVLGSVLGRVGPSSNIALGEYALLNLEDGASNTAIGVGALANNTTAYQNTAVGKYALSENTTGQFNVAIGYAALASATASGNVAIGQDAIGSLQNGDNNTVIGFNAGRVGFNNLASGSNNILIGSNVATSSSLVSNEITLGNSGNTRLRIPGLGIDWTIDTVPSSSGGGAEGADIMNIMEAW